MTSRRSRLSIVPLVAALSLASCKGAEQVCNPTDPLCGGGGGGTTVASVTVTSAIDTVMAVGRTAAMTAVARDASNNIVSGLTVNWTSLTMAAATVDAASGVVTGVAPGTSIVRAAQSNNAVTGQLQMRVVNADLPAVTATLADPFVTALRGALSATPQSTVNGLATTCAGHVTSGNLLALNTCLNGIIAVSGGSNGTDNALLAVLDLFAQHAQRRLQL